MHGYSNPDDGFYFGRTRNEVKFTVGVINSPRISFVATLKKGLMETTAALFFLAFLVAWDKHIKSLANTLQH